MSIDMKTSSFACNSKFYAQEHFPYGLSRSGEFTREQVSLLENHGRAYQALCDGSREANTEEERGFILVCRGEKAANSSHEKAWLRFCEKTQGQAAVSSPSKADPSVSEASGSDLVFDEDL